MKRSKTQNSNNLQERGRQPLCHTKRAVSHTTEYNVSNRCNCEAQAERCEFKHGGLSQFVNDGICSQSVLKCKRNWRTNGENVADLGPAPLRVPVHSRCEEIRGCAHALCRTSSPDGELMSSIAPWEGVCFTETREGIGDGFARRPGGALRSMQPFLSSKE